MQVQVRAAGPEDGREKLGELLSDSEQTKTEVWAATLSTGVTQLELVEHSWASGIGWYVQKRLTLDGSQAEALQALLCSGTPIAGPPRRAPGPPPLVEREGNILRLVFPD
jgi:hypothetical protein